MGTLDIIAYNSSTTTPIRTIFLTLIENTIFKISAFSVSEKKKSVFKKKTVVIVLFSMKKYIKLNKS